MNRKEETKAFREWLEAWLMPSEFSPGYLYKLDDDGEYAIDFVRTAWEAWEARALRASAAPEEGMEENLADAREFCKAAFGPFNVDTEPYAKIIAELMDRASQRSKYNTYNALPSDSGKAEPVAWRWKYFEADNWHYREERPQDTTGDLAQSLYAAPPGTPVADQIIGQIEDRFPNWKSYRDLIDCIDCTLHALRAALAPATEGGPVTHPSADRKGEANV